MRRKIGTKEVSDLNLEIRILVLEASESGLCFEFPTPNSEGLNLKMRRGDNEKI